MAFGQSVFSMDASFEPFLTNEIYALRAKEFLDCITKERSLYLHERHVIDFLEERINNAQLIVNNILSDEKAQKEINLFLQPDSVRLMLQLGIYQKDDSMSRAWQYFPKMLLENLSCGLRSKIACYIDTLAAWEKDSNYEQVSFDEYKKRFNKYFGEGNAKFNRQLIIESKKFAEAIIYLIKNS